MVLSSWDENEDTYLGCVSPNNIKGLRPGLLGPQSPGRVFCSLHRIWLTPLPPRCPASRTSSSASPLPSALPPSVPPRAQHSACLQPPLAVPPALGAAVAPALGAAVAPAPGAAAA